MHQISIIFIKHKDELGCSKLFKSGRFRYTRDPSFESSYT